MARGVELPANEEQRLLVFYGEQAWHGPAIHLWAPPGIEPAAKEEQKLLGLDGG